MRTARIKFHNQADGRRVPELGTLDLEACAAFEAGKVDRIAAAQASIAERRKRRLALLTITYPPLFYEMPSMRRLRVSEPYCPAHGGNGQVAPVVGSRNGCSQREGTEGGKRTVGQGEGAESGKPQLRRI